jgi:Ulp1 family protease
VVKARAKTGRRAIVAVDDDSDIEEISDAAFVDQQAAATASAVDAPAVAVTNGLSSSATAVTASAAASAPATLAASLSVRRGTRRVLVTRGDAARLAPGEFLNDSLIDFYLEYLFLRHLPSDADRARFHIFSSLFYGKLTKVREHRFA